MIGRGEIYFVDLSPEQRFGTERTGHMFVLVVSSDAINGQDRVVTVVPGTDARNAPRDYATNVRVSAKESGLPMDTVFLCFQVRSLDPSRFVDSHTGSSRIAGRMPPERMREVEAALRLVLEL